MIYCLNPNCPNPQNPDEQKFCLSCGTGLTPLLRGRYRVVSALGGGEFGRTYLAEDIDKLNENCVVKQLAPRVQEAWVLQKATQLFEQEAKRLQQLGKHPQIPTLYAYFGENNYLYLVQEFIEGNNLLQELEREGVFDEVKIRELLHDLLPVLSSVHSQQVIHRDIKPANIIRRQSDRKLVLIDFGAAKQITATIMAGTGTIIGSLGYAPFEQMHEGEAYPSSDLHGLGATCFNLMTQISPQSLWQVQGYDWVQHWQQHLKYPISNELEQILNKLLSENPYHRYQSADEVLKDLNKNLSQNQKQAPTVVVSPTVNTPAVTEPAENQTGRWKIGVGVAVIAIAIGIGIALNYSTAPKSIKPASVSPIFENLDSSLKARNWQQANAETFALMLQLAGRKKEGWLDPTSLISFSCSDLKTIDQLWVKYSNGLFGFSVQKRIYLATGNRLGAVDETDSKEWTNFADSVGWKRGEFESNMIKGHFPFFRRGNTYQTLKNIDQILFAHCDL